MDVWHIMLIGVVFWLVGALTWVLVRERYNDEMVYELLCWPFYLPLYWVLRKTGIVREMRYGKGRGRTADDGSDS
jgi:hypothetical protein